METYNVANKQTHLILFVLCATVLHVLLKFKSLKESMLPRSVN